MRPGFASLVAWAVVFGTAFVALASCGGVSSRRASSDDDADGNAGSGGTDTGGMVGRGGTLTGGTVGQGGLSQGGVGGTGGSSTMPNAGRPGLGGTTGIGGENSTAGAPGCRFEPLPEGYRCENAGSRVQDETSVFVGYAGTLSQCEQACLMNPACTAITQYVGESGPKSCSILTETCGDPVMGPEAEEDAGKHYRRVCDDFGCRLEYLGHFLQCSNYASAEQWVGATSRAQCDRACLADPNCGGVVDYFWIDEIAGCYLYTSTCNDPEPLPFGDPGRSYVLNCD